MNHLRKLGLASFFFLGLGMISGAMPGSTMGGTPQTAIMTGRCCAGYSLLLYRTSMGLRDELAYADALHLLERGADPNRVPMTE